MLCCPGDDHMYTRNKHPTHQMQTMAAMGETQRIAPNQNGLAVFLQVSTFLLDWFSVHFFNVFYN